MTSEKISEEKQTITLKITIEPAVFKRALQAVHRRNARRFQVPGFRRGKAPYPIVVNYYGEEVFYDDAVNDTLPKAYEEALKELDISARSMPRFDIKTISGEEGLVAEAKVASEPDVKLGTYEGVTAYRPTPSVEDAEVDAKVNEARERVARVVPVTDRAIEKGDTVVIDYKGLLDGEPFKGGSAEGHSLEIGSGAFIPGFEDGLIGHHTGDAFDLPLTFPENYHAKELAGKDVVFQVNVQSVTAKELPELDDAFARDVSETADTLEEYLEEIRQDLLSKKNQEADRVFEDNILDAIVKDADLSYSDLMVEDEVDQAIENNQRQFAMYNLKFSDFLKYSGQTLYDYRQRLAEDSRKQIARACVIDAIRKARGDQFELSDEAFDEEVAKAAEEAGVSVDVFKDQYLKDEAQREDFRRHLEIHQLLDWLRGVSVATDQMPEGDADKEDAEDGADHEETTSEDHAPADDAGEGAADADKPQTDAEDVNA